MSDRSLRRGIHGRVYASLKSRLNGIGLNVTNKRVWIVMDALEDDPGYDRVRDKDIAREVSKLTRELDRQYTSR